MCDYRNELKAGLFSTMFQGLLLANESHCYNVTLPLIGLMHSFNKIVWDFSMIVFHKTMVALLLMQWSYNSLVSKKS